MILYIKSDSNLPDFPYCLMAEDQKPQIIIIIQQCQNKEVSTGKFSPGFFSVIFLFDMSIMKS